MSTPRLLIVNPNTNTAVTGWLATEARRAAAAAFEIIAINADSGLAAIETPEGLEIAARAVVACLATQPEADAAVIAAFGDPGLEAARSAGLMPVMGLGEAGLRAAAAGGQKFSILTLGAAMRTTVLTKAAALGVSSELAELHILPFSIGELVADREARISEIAAAASRCAGDVVLLAGAPFAGMAATISRHSRRVVLDGVAACVEEVTRFLVAARAPSDGRSQVTIRQPS